MKSCLVLLAASLLIFLSSAAHTERAQALQGAEAPALALENEQGVKSLSALRGKYVVVNFWNSADPQSRIDNALIDRAVKKANSEVEYIAVCTDSTPDLFGSILQADGLDKAHQYLYESSQPGIVLSKYCSPGECVAFLIDPQGRVVTTSVDEILSQLN